MSKSSAALRHVMALGAVCAVSGLGVGDVSAARTFDVAYSDVINGGFARAANGLLECDRTVHTGATSRCNDTNKTDDSPLLFNNNDTTVTWTDVDSDAATENSSQATLAMPATSSVAWAGLYWIGNRETGGRTGTSVNTMNQVKLMLPGTNTYVAITADWCDEIGVRFACFADVSALVSMGGSGDYMVADVRANVGRDDFVGGWEILASYRDETAGLKSLTAFHGHQSYGTTSRTFDFEDFLTPLVGPIEARVGVSIGEGDDGSTDSGTFEAESAASATAFGVDPATPSLIPTNDLGNGSLTIFGSNVLTRTPAHHNTLGFDVDVFDASALMNNGDTSATVIVGGSSGETNELFKVDFEVDIYFPDIQVDKTVVDLNGGDVVPGDTLEYTIVTRNAASAFDTAINTVLTDDIPDGLDYEVGTMSFQNVGEAGFTALMDDAADGDLGSYDAGANSLTVYLGNSAAEGMGGTLAPGDEVTLVFRATVKDLTEPLSIENTALVAHEGQTLASGGTTRPVRTPSVDPGDLTPGPTTVVGGPDPDGDGLKSDQDLDEDNDGILDTDESGGANPDADSDGDLLEDWRDSDTAGFVDANNDDVDDRLDFDLDGVPNHLDLDSDGDGISDLIEAGGTAALDGDGDGVVDGNADSDEDGILDAVDVDVMGSVQLDPTIDTDGTELADFLDVDDDGDGILTSQELADTNALGDADPDGDFVPAWRDTDSDDDLIDDEDETDDVDDDNIPDYLDADVVLIDAPAAGAALATRTFAAQGEIAPGLSVVVQLFDSSGVVVDTQTVTADATSGEWTASLDAGADGAFTVRASVTDATTNTAVDTVGVSIDTLIPTLAVNAPADGAAFTDDTPTISGTTEANASVTVDVGGQTLTTTANNAGAWSVTPTTLAEGDYTIVANAQDAAGNAAPQVTSNFTVDQTNPTLAVNTPADGGTTGDSTPDIMGTTEPNASVTVVLDAGTADEQTLTTTADNTGAWSVTAAILSEGPHTLTADAVDAAGNTAPQVTSSFAVDLTGPGLTLDSPVDGTRVGTLASASGTGEEGAQVEVFVGGVSVGTVTVPAGGMWSVSFTQPATDGDYTVRAESTDPAGNAATPLEATVTLDTTGPGVAIGSPADGDTVGTLTTVSGTTTGSDAATVEVLVDGVSAGTANVLPNGTWSLTLAQPTDGDRTLTAIASDDLGNAGAPDSVTVTLDTGAPVLTVNTPAQDFASDSDTVTVSGTTDALATVTVVITDAAGTDTTLNTTADALGNFSVDATGLAEGDYTASVTAQDALGNTTTPVTRDFSVDLTAPTLAVDSPTDGASTSDDTPDISGTTEPNASVTVVLDAGTADEQVLTTTADNAGAWSVTAATLGEGTHTLTADAQDAAGNDAPQVTSSFEVDQTPPTVALVSPAEGDTVEPDVDVTGTSDGANEIYVVVDAGTANERELGPVTPAANGDWTVNVTGLSDGPHTLTVRAEDAAENAATDGPINVTAQGVVLTIDSPVDGDDLNDATPALVGKADPNATVTLVLDEGTAQEQTLVVQANSDGDWFLFSPTLADGPHTLSASVDDGNGGTLERDVSFSTDTLAPSLSLTAPADGDVSSEDEPTITGTGDAGETVEVFVDGTKLGETVVANDGTWSLPWSGNPLSEGPHTILATSTDEAGNVSEQTADIIVDQTAPLLTLSEPVDGSTSADTTPTVSGQTEPGATVLVFVDGAQVGMTTADGFGAWTFELPTALADGAHTIGAQAQDEAGNTSPVQEVGITIDSSLPVVDIASPADGSATSEQTPTISGTAAANAEVTVSVDGTEVGTATADANGDWSLTLTDALDEGSHTAVASVTNGADTATDTSTFDVDLTAPALTLDTPTTGESVNTDTPEFTGTTEPGGLVELTLPDGSMELVRADNNGDWSFVPTNPLAEGENTVGAVAIDEAGNRSPAEDVTFSVDITAPVVDITSPNDGSVSNDTDPSFSGTSEPGASVELRVDGTLVDTVIADAQGNWTSDAGGPFADGVHTLQATASDAAGNTASDSADFIVDTRAPDLSISTPVQGNELDTATPTVTGLAEPNATVEVFVDGTKVGDATADDQGMWSLELPDPLDNGEHTITVRSEDGAGNFANDQVDFTVNVLEMILTVDSPTPGQVLEDTTPTITGTANPGETVEVFVDGTKVGDALADDDGNWSLELTDELGEGEHTIDASGESGATVGPITFTVDTAAPVVTITSPTPGEETNDATPTITGTGEPGDEVTIVIDGTPAGTTTVDDEGNWTFTPADELGEGDHTIEATVDGGGSSGEVTLTVDTTPPGVVITAPTEGEEVTPGGSVTGTTEPGAEVIITVDGEEIGRTNADDEGNFSFDLPDSLPTGDATIGVEARDPAGNSSSDTRDVTIGQGGDDNEFDQFALKGGCTGCSSAPGAPADASLLLLAFGLFGWRRRKRAA